MKRNTLDLKEIKKNITYVRKTYERATFQVDISGLDANGAAEKVKEAVEAICKQTVKEKSEQSAPKDGQLSLLNYTFCREIDDSDGKDAHG